MDNRDMEQATALPHTNSPSQGPNRHQRRAQKVQVKQANSPAHVVRILALEQTVQALVKAQNENLQHLQQAFHMVDAHIWVLQRLGKDLTENAVEKNEDGTLKLEAYYQRFNDSVKEAMAKQPEEASNEAE